jgi:transcriptional regulator with XRE-family HTH domain
MAKSRDRTPFGQRMFDAREVAGLTQMQVRERLKVSQGTLSELERTAHSTRRLVDFAMLYQVNPRWLATGEGVRDAAPMMSAEEPNSGYTIDTEARQLLADFYELLPEDQAEWRARIHDRAEQMRKHAEMVLRRAGVANATRGNKKAGKTPGGGSK